MADGTIKSKLQLDGEQQYKKALNDAYRSLRVLRSELKAETAELGRNATAQDKARTKVASLKQQIEEQQKVVKTLDALVSKGIEDELDLDMDIEVFDEIVMVLDTVTTFLLICTLFSVAFSVGGGASRLTPLVAVGLAFSTLNCLIFCGFLIVLLNLAAHITLIVFMTQLNKEYREYRHSYMMA